MAKVSTYLNFAGNTEEAFNFYKSVFETDFINAISRYGDMPSDEGQPKMSEEQKKLVINVQLPTLGDHVLMGTDNLREELVRGNNVYINLEPDTNEQTDALFNRLGKDGQVDTPLQTMFWGDYYGSLTDKFGIHWMFNCAAKN